MALFEHKFHATQWHEGMLLGAQHLQHADFYHHAFLHHHLQAVGVFHWGVFHLALDPAQLVAGVYQVLECQAFMPDGTIINYRLDDGYDLALSFKDLGEILCQKPLKIHLAIPRSRANASYADQEKPRYRSVLASNVIDLNTGDNPIDLPVLVPQCLLLKEEDLTSQYVSFPLAEIGVQDDAYRVTSFNPPCIKVIPETPFGQTCLQILAHLKEKMLLLNDRLQSSSLPEAIASMLQEQFRIVMPALPSLEALLYSRQAHPFQVYMALMQAVGHLMTLKPEQAIQDIPRYDHHQLDQVFHTIFTMIRKYTDDLGRRLKRLSFQEEQGIFKLHLDPGWVRTKLLMGLRPTPSMTEHDLTQWMSGALIASGHALSDAKDRRVLGASRTLMVTVDDLHIVPPLGTVLYEVDVDPFFIQPQEELHIFNPSASQKPAEIFLFVREES